MADPINRLMNINIYSPNPAIAEMLAGPRVADNVERLTLEVFTIYQASLPVRTGNLKNGAYHYIAFDGWGEGEKDRWFGYVGNRALSYRGRKGVPYGAFIEWGKGARPGQHQLRNAAEAVFGSDMQFGHGSPGNAPRARRGDVNPKTGLQNFRNRKGQFTKGPQP